MSKKVIIIIASVSVVVIGVAVYFITKKQATKNVVSLGDTKVDVTKGSYLDTMLNIVKG